MLAEPAPLPVVEGGHNAAKRVDGAHIVADGQCHLCGGAVRLPGHVHDAGAGLGDDVIAGLAGVRAAVAKGGDGAVDQPGVQGPRGLIPKAQLVHHAGAVTLDEDISLLDHPAQRLLSAGVLEIQDNGLFALVLPHVGGAHAADHGGKIAAVVAHDGLFNVNDLRPVLGQQMARRRTCKVVGQVQHQKPPEHFFFLFHIGSPQMVGKRPVCLTQVPCLPAARPQRTRPAGRWCR